MGHWRGADGPNAPTSELVKEVPTSEKWLEAQCSLGASIHITSAEGVVIEFVADGDRTKIESFQGQRQASALLGGKIHHASGSTPTVRPTIYHTGKCELLEIADFCAYAAQRYWHLRSDDGIRAARWRSWYKQFNFMFARCELEDDGRFVINAEAHTPTREA